MKADTDNGKSILNTTNCARTNHNLKGHRRCQHLFMLFHKQVQIYMKGKKKLLWLKKKNKIKEEEEREKIKVCLRNMAKKKKKSS